MGVWVAKPKLEADERIRWQSTAGRSLNRWITSGGRLIVTNQRVLFQPNRFDVITGKKPWECPLTSVTGLYSLDRDPTVLAGGLRKRLEIQTLDGAETFVIDQLNDKIQTLRELPGVVE
jgi:hypothetical protein